MGMELNRNLTPKEQIPLLKATEELFGPECEPKHRMFGATIWSPDGIPDESHELAIKYFRDFREARKWAKNELLEQQAIFFREKSFEASFEAEFDAFKASTHDWLMFDQDPSGAQRFRDATVSLEDDPRFQSVIRLNRDGSFEEEC